MKTNYKLTLLAAVVAAFAVISTANAQTSPAATIAASPKVQAQLDERQARVAMHSETTQHLCADCKDTVVTTMDRSPKGAKLLVSNTVHHACAACDTKIVTQGVGKAKQDVAIHSCKNVAKPLCCAQN